MKKWIMAVIVSTTIRIVDFERHRYLQFIPRGSIKSLNKLDML